MAETNPMYDPRCNHDLPIPGAGCNRDMWTCRYPECTYPEAAPRRVRTEVDGHGNFADDCGHCTLLPAVSGYGRAVKVGCPVHSEHPAARRLRTQAERDADGAAWYCGAFRPAPPAYRCTEPYDHPGHHRATIDGQVVAEWHRYTRRNP